MGFFLYLVLYVYLAYCLMEMGKRLSVPEGWMAWVPIVNAYYSIKLASRPGWWLLLMFIPLVNLVILVVVWRDISRNLGFSANLGWLIIIPLLNIFLPGYLAFSNVPTRPSQPVS